MAPSDTRRTGAPPTDPSFSSDFERWRKACSTVMGVRSPCSTASSSSSSASRSMTAMRYPIRSTTNTVTETAQQPASLPEALGEHQETPQERKERERTEQWTDQLVRTSPMIRFMTKHLTMVSCSPLAEPAPGAPPPLLIAPCPPDTAGGFSPSPPGEPHSRSAILICSNRIFSKSHLEDTLAHEMVHWWDHCRFKVDWSDLKHHACSEIRAAALSGDCKWTREIKRRNFGFTKQHQACARRRAILSVEVNPACKSHDDAVKAVDEVFNSCWADTRPFDEIY